MKLSNSVGHAVGLTAAVCGFGIWCSMECHWLMPWSRSVIGQDGWRWVWFVPTIYPVLSAIFWVLFSGCLLSAAIGLTAWATDRVTGFPRRDWRGISACLQVPGFALLVGWGLCFAAQYFSDRLSAGVLWAAYLWMGRCALFAVLWNVLDMDRHLQKLPAVVKRPVLMLSLFTLTVACCVGVNVLYNAYQNTVLASGDEPSYIYMSKSLLRDGDLSVGADEESEYSVQVCGNTRLKDAFHSLTGISGEAVPLHFPGVSVMLLPVTFWTLNPVVLRLYLLAFYCAWILLSYLLTVRMVRNVWAAAAATVVVAVSFPMLNMSMLIYPDAFCGYFLTAALLSAGEALYRREARLTFLRMLGMLAVACLLPWFHQKYGLYSIVLGGFALYKRPEAFTPRRMASVLSVVAAGVLGFFVYYLHLYGFAFAAASKISYDGIFGMLIDCDSGWITNAPWVMLLPLGLVYAVRRLDVPKSCGLFWILLFFATYLPNSLVSHWAEPTSSLLRYMTPFAAICHPLLASAFLYFSRRPMIIAGCSVISFLGAAEYLHVGQTYARPDQIGRTLLDNSVFGFSYQDFFPCFNYFMRVIDYPLVWWHGAVLLAVLVSAVILFGRFRNHRPGVTLVLVFLPLVLAGICCLFHSPNRTMNAQRLFIIQTRSIQYMQEKRKLAMRSLLNVPRPISTDLVSRVSAVFSPAMRPLEIHPQCRELTKGNGIMLHPSDRYREVGYVLLDKIASGFYRISLWGPEGARKPDPQEFLVYMQRALPLPSSLRGVTRSKILPPAASKTLYYDTVVYWDGSVPTPYFLIHTRLHSNTVLDAVQVEYLGDL